MYRCEICDYAHGQSQQGATVPEAAVDVGNLVLGRDDGKMICNHCHEETQEVLASFTDEDIVDVIERNKPEPESDETLLDCLSESVNEYFDNAPEKILDIALREGIEKAKENK